MTINLVTDQNRFSCSEQTSSNRQANQSDNRQKLYHFIASQILPESRQNPINRLPAVPLLSSLPLNRFAEPDPFQLLRDKNPIALKHFIMSYVSIQNKANCLGLARAYRLVGREDLAHIFFSRLLRLSPDDTEVLWQRAKSWIVLDQHFKALKDLYTIENKEGASPKLTLKIISVLFLQSNLKVLEIHRLQNHILNDQIKLKSCLLMTEKLLQIGYSSIALQFIECFRAICGDRPKFLLQIAKIYAMHQNLEACFHYLALAERESKNKIKILFEKLRILIQLNMRDLVESCVKEMSDNYSYHYVTKYSIALFNAYKGEYAKAVELLSKDIEEHPSNLKNYHLRAVCHYNMGLYEKAFEDADRITLENPTHMGAQEIKELVWGCSLQGHI